VPRFGGLLVVEQVEDLSARLKQVEAQLDDLKEFL
jgi:hypothetical protein